MHRFRILSLLLVAALLLLTACANFDAPSADPLAALDTVAHPTDTEAALAPVEPLPDVVKTASFAAIGDNLVHPCIYIDARNRAVAGGREYNFKPPYADILPLLDAADYAFINQETPMAGAQFGYSGYPQFNSPQDLGYDLVEMGFDIIGLANNHMLDKGAAGYAGTIAFAKTLDALTIGAYENEAEYRDIAVIEKDGFKIAMLAFTHHTNYIKLPASSTLYVPYASDEEITRQVKAAQELADAVIVSIHWGTDNGNMPDDEQKHYAQLMADLEVDVILGHHSHTVQPIVELVGKTGHKTLCIYSLGNIISGMAEPKNMLGGVFAFTLVSTNGEVTFTDVSFTPTVYHFGPSYYNGHIYLLEDYTAELHNGHGTWRQYGNYSTLEDMYGYLHRAIEDKYLPAAVRKVK